MIEIQGHRGARGLRPESTLQSFEVALDLLVPTLELDCHLTADDQVLIWHDEALWDTKVRLRGPGGTELPIPIRSLRLEQLQNYVADRNPEPERFELQRSDPTEIAGGDYLLASLQDLFDFVARYSAPGSGKEPTQRANAARVEFNIETKRVEAHPEYIGDGFDGENVGTFEVAIIDAMDSAGVTERCTIQSFDFRSLRAIARARPDIRLSALTEELPDFDEICDFGASIWSPSYGLLTTDVLTRAQRSGLRVLPWTVNETADMDRLAQMGVDGFITDRPDLAMKLLTHQP